ncbi:MAG: hypothetical protein U1E76_22360 [Planctomycetota bacterium]
MLAEPRTAARPDGAAAEDRNEGAAPTGATDRLQELWQSVRALEDQIARLVSARTGQLKLTLKRLFLTLALALVAGLVLAAAVVAGVALLAVGIADGLSQLLRSWWLGHVATGLLLLLAMLGGLWAAVRFLATSSARRTIARFAAWQEHRSRIEPTPSNQSKLAS